MTACAAVAMGQCPFLRGDRDWRSAEARGQPLLAPYRRGVATVLARSWRSHSSAGGAWHFEALGTVERVPVGDGRASHS
jgi:hypothetical protein